MSVSAKGASTRVKIKELPESEQPRAKLMQKGPEYLTNAELLTVLIGSGTVKYSATELAWNILHLTHHNIHTLGRLSVEELRRAEGLGEAKAVLIAAALELGRRRQLQQGMDRPVISNTHDAADILFPLLRDLNYEAFCVLYLNQANKLIRHEIVSKGGLNATIVDTRTILKEAVLISACKLILAHNHPSGNPKPSQADLHTTARIREAAHILDIHVLDHIIISENSYFSFLDEGIMP